MCPLLRTDVMAGADVIALEQAVCGTVERWNGTVEWPRAEHALVPSPLANGGGAPAINYYQRLDSLEGV